MSQTAAPEVTEKERMYAALFTEQASRRLSLSALARETGIPSGTLSWWKKEIRRRESRRSSCARPEFVPVTVRDTKPLTADAGFEVLLPNGVRLRVPSAFDESALRRLVVTLASAC